MVILIAGASHTGKTCLAQKLLETHHYPYLSMDHLKMGLIRSGKTSLTVYDDEGLTDELWPIVREMVKTAIENRQNLVVEGCYIPFTWREDFGGEYLREIRCRWLVMTPEYIQTHFDDIRRYANAIETRLEDSRLRPEQLVRENVRNLELCEKYGCDYLLVDEAYRVDPGHLFGEFAAEETL